MSTGILVYQVHSAQISILETVVESQYHEIISDTAAWVIADEGGEDLSLDKGFKTTNSARRIRALVEQVTGQFSCGGVEPDQ